MFRNYLKSAFRNSIRNKGYTLINAFGLAVGLCIFMLLFFYIRHEKSFNMYNSKADRIYRIIETTGPQGLETEKTTNTNWSMSASLKAEFPEVEEITRVFRFGGSLVKYGEKRFLERNYYVVERSYFDVFDHDIQSGTIPLELQSGLADIVMSASTASKYFGGENPIGKMVSDERFGDCKVVAVYKDYPLNSSFRPEFLYLTEVKRWPQNRQRFYSSWENRNCGAYVVLKKDAAVAGVMEKKKLFLQKHLQEKWPIRDFQLQPMTEFHLHSSDIDAISQTSKGNFTYMFVFGLIAVFVLIVAIINYINLSTARAIYRRKEAGIRKVVGASSQQIIMQFMVESMLHTMLSLITALCLMEIALPWFNLLTERSITVPYFEQPLLLLVVLAVAGLTGIFSGAVPALIISAYQPGQVIQGFSAQKSGKFLSRKALVVFQFSLSTLMIIATLIVHRQMKFVQDRDLGFDKERKLVIDINDEDIRQPFKAIKSELMAHPDITHVSAISNVPGDWKYLYTVEIGKSKDEYPVVMPFIAFDEDVLSTMHISLKAGDNFTGNDKVDSLYVLLNEEAAGLLGGESVIGQSINIRYDGDDYSYRVRGIVEDFNFESLHQEIRPVVIGPWNNNISMLDYFVVSTKGDPSEAVDHATAVHDKFAPESAIEYNFLDQQWERYYKDDLRRGQVFGISAGLTVFIACLGLFGLASFSTSLRTKEFGIRKVLGATDSHLVYLVSKEFIFLVSMGYIIASPMAYWLMSSWLSTFAYNAGMSPGIFIATGLTVLIIAVLTVGFKSLQAARQDPVKSLRSE